MLSKRPSSAGPSNGAVSSSFPFHRHCASLTPRGRRRYDGRTHLGRRDIPNYFREEPFYVDLIDLMDEVCTITPLQKESP